MLIENGLIVSTREVYREIEDSPIEELRSWAKHHRELFSIPTAAEGAFVARVYAIPHFQQNIERQKILKGGNNADAFVIAKAAAENAVVVTMEILRPNASKIPNICDHFKVRWMTLEGFMEAEGWSF